MASLGRILIWTRAHGARAGGEVLFNFLLPYLVYAALMPRLGEAGALLASSVPPIVWSLGEFILRRSVDAVSILVLAGIGLSLLAFAGGGSVKLLQLREKLVTVVIGLVFLGSAAIGRPLIYHLARAGLRRRSGAELEAFEALRDNARFRRTMKLMTLVWGFGLLVDAGLAIALVFALPIATYLLVSPVLSSAVMGGLVLWTAWYARRQKKQRPAEPTAAFAPEARPGSAQAAPLGDAG